MMTATGAIFVSDPSLTNRGATVGDPVLLTYTAQPNYPTVLRSTYGYLTYPSNSQLTTATFIVPCGVNRIDYIMVGGGGGGGGAGGGTLGAAGGGGGAGQVVQGHMIVAGGARVSIVVGAGGQGGRANNGTGGTVDAWGCPVPGGYIIAQDGAPGQDSVITVCCVYANGKLQGGLPNPRVIRARGGCPGGGGNAGKACGTWGYGSPFYRYPVAGNGGHSWYPIYREDLLNNKTNYYLPRDIYKGCPADASYMNTPTCPVAQEFRPSGAYKPGYARCSTFGYPARGGQASYSWLANPDLTYGAYNRYHGLYAFRVVIRARCCCNAHGGGGAGAFGSGGPCASCNYFSPYSARVWDNNYCKNTAAVTNRGFGNVCQHRFYTSSYPSSGLSNACAVGPGIGGPWLYACYPNTVQVGYKARSKTSKNSTTDYHWCIQNSHCCVRIFGSLDPKIQCPTYVNNWISPCLSGWALGGRGGNASTSTGIAYGNGGPGSGGQGGKFTGLSRYATSGLATACAGLPGRPGSIYIFYQPEFNSSAAREILQARPSLGCYPCLPSVPPTTGRVATYASGYSGMGFADPITSPLRTLAIPATCYRQNVQVSTPNPNYIAGLPAGATSCPNPQYYCRTYNRQYINRPIGSVPMQCIRGKCFVKMYKSPEQDYLVSDPVPKKAVIPVFVPKQGVCTTSVTARITIWAGGGGGGADFCSTHGGGGGGGGGGGSVRVYNCVVLKSIKCYSAYSIVVGGGGSGGFTGSASFNYPSSACSGGSSYVNCLSCGPRGFRVTYQYNSTLPGTGIVSGGRPGSCNDGGISDYPGGTGFICSTSINYGSGGGGGGSGGSGASVGSCPYAGGVGGIGTSILLPYTTPVQAYVGGGGGGGSAYIDGYVTRVAGNYNAPGNGGIGGFATGGCGGSIFKSGESGKYNTGQGGGGSGPRVYQHVVFTPAPPPPFWGSIVGGVFGFFLFGTGLGALAGAVIGSLIPQGGNGSISVQQIAATTDLYGRPVDGYGGDGGSGGVIIEYQSKQQEFESYYSYGGVSDQVVVTSKVCGSTILWRHFFTSSASLSPKK